MDYVKWIKAEITNRIEPRKKTEFMVALAESMEMTKTTLYAYLRGEYPFNSDQIDAAARFFGVESPSRSKKQKTTDQSQPEAIYSELPRFTGDGYDYGGGAVVTIGGKSLILGEGREAYELAHELVQRWNAGRAI